MNQKLRCIIVDDEPLALELLSDYVQKLPDIELVCTTTKVLDALSFIQQNKADLVLLDIQMPDLNGIQFLKLTQGKCKAILTTAYPQYALEGYEYDVIDYLIKPIGFDRFVKAIQKAQGYFFDKTEETTTHLIEHNLGQELPDFIFVKVEHKIKKINIPDILYLEGLKDYVSIFTTSERILTLQTMKKIEESLLPFRRFIRVHKSYIVALDKIDYVERQRIFIGKNSIPLGDTYKEEFLKTLGT